MNQVVYRILLFYIGSLVVLLALYPWVEVKSNSSPFVMIFHNLDSNVVASALNFVILVASLSVYNSGVYSNSRMLFGLSVQGNAPKFLTRVSHRGVPVNSLMLSGAITSLVVLINYLLPQKAFSLLMALVVATLLLNWIMICLAHLRFRAAMRRKGRETQFKALFYPAGNYLCIAFLALILVLMCTMDDMRLSAILLPVWIVFLFIAFTVLRRKAHYFFARSHAHAIGQSINGAMSLTAREYRCRSASDEYASQTLPPRQKYGRKYRPGCSHIPATRRYW